MPTLPANFTRMLKASPPAVVFAPGHTFFTRRLDLPPEIQPSEIEGFVELVLEDLSPFPVDQLYFGYAVAENATAVLVYATYRRRFPSEVTRAWAEAAFVVPDFVPALQRTFERDTTVFLETGETLSILAFRAGKPLPFGILSRPQPASEPPPVLEAWRQGMRQNAAARGLLFEDELHLDGDWLVQERTNSLLFRMSPVGVDPEETIPVDGQEPVPGEEATEPEAVDTMAPSAGKDPQAEDRSGEVVSIPTPDLWAMDIRDPDYLAGRRQSVRVDTFIWRGILGIAAALMLLLAGEIILIGGKVSLGVVAGLTARRQGEVERIEDRQGIVERLAEFDRSNSVPFEMLKAINTARPRSVYFTRAATEGRNDLIIDAATQNVSDVNQYESSLRSLPEVQAVEVRNLKPRDDGTTFTLVVTFRPGAFEPTTGGMQTASR